MPTYDVCGELLQRHENEAQIDTAKRETFSYGPHEQQNSDLYSSAELAPIIPKNPRTSRFGGHFDIGDRFLDSIPDNLANKKYGLLTLEKDRIRCNNRGLSVLSNDSS
jgi:hypothetical protein